MKVREANHGQCHHLGDHRAVPRGLVTGALVVVAVAVRREDRSYSLGLEAPSRISRSARILTGVACRDLDA
jgi:hypothetical protein